MVTPEFRHRKTLSSTFALNFCMFYLNFDISQKLFFTRAIALHFLYFATFPRTYKMCIILFAYMLYK